MREPPVKLVLDTNVIVSGFLWKGVEFDLLRSVEEVSVLMFLTSDMVKELDRVLRYPRLEKVLKKAGLTSEVLLEKVVSLAHLVVGSGEHVTVCRDVDDNKILECALLAGAEYVVTGDDDLLVLKKFRTVCIVTTKELLRVLDDSE